jgi:O-antigen/teichoic acid export membrane protein
VSDSDPKVLDISGSVATGVRWKMLTQVVSEGSRVVVTVILARILTPADYGVAGMALVCASFTLIFTDPSLGTALLQKRRISEADRSTVFWATLATGSLATILGIALSGVVADIFGQPQLESLFMVLSLTFFVSGLTVTHIALLYRELAYRSLEIREIVATVVAATAAVIVALAGFGPWAIIANYVVFTLTSTALIWFLSPWRPHLTFSTESLRHLGSFGAGVFGARILNWGTMNMDNALVGRYLGAAALGAYGLAYNVMFLPIVRVATPLAQVVSPAYARMQDHPERLETAWLRSKRVSVLLLAPAFLGCIVVAPDLVPVAFGPNWHAAVVPLQLLSLAGLAVSLVTLHWGILTALRKGGTLLTLQILVGVVTIASFAAGVPFGIVGVAGFYAAARWLLVPADIFITTRAIKFSFWRTLGAGTVVLPMTIGAAACAFGLRLLLVAESVPPIVRLVVVAAALLAVYVVLLRLFVPDLLTDVISLARRSRARSSAPRASLPVEASD